MKIYSIYKSTNKISGKVYIGFDSNWPSRKKAHKLGYKKSKFKFHNAIKKYGWENFEWDIIYQSTDGNHCLNEMESHFINEYNSYKKGYNSTLGGEGALGLKRFFSEETRKKMSDSHLGKTVNANTKNKISNTLKGRVLSSETKNKMSRWQKGKPKKDSEKERLKSYNEKKYKCPHCNETYSISKLKQWHLDKCNKKH